MCRRIKFNFFKIQSNLIFRRVYLDNKIKNLQEGRGGVDGVHDR